MKENCSTRDLSIRSGRRLLISAVLVFFAITNPVLARTALVIGNSEYASAPLENPVNDATDIADRLGNLDFEVTILTNATRKSMRRAIREYSEKLRQSGDVGLFYYAGHGMQIDGINYLIPVDAIMQNEFEIPDEAVAANSVLRALEEAGNDLNIVILDACRDNPFAKSYRSAATRGLARMDAPGGSIIAYATAPGDVALDGIGRNGVYTKHLLKNMAKPGMPIEQMFKKVRIGVIDDSGGKQTPWEESSLRSDFYFSPAKVYEVDIPKQSESAQVLTSKQVLPAVKTPPPPRVASAAPISDVAVNAMLSKATQAIKDDRLTTPERDSALFYYREALKLDPVNLDAHDGLQRITRRYINLAQREIDTKNISRAQDFIARGLSIHPTNIRLQDMRLQTERLKVEQAKLGFTAETGVVKSNAIEQPVTMAIEAPAYTPPPKSASRPNEEIASSTESEPEQPSTATEAQNISRIQEQKEAFREDVSELTNSIKGLGKTLKGGFDGLFKKSGKPGDKK